MNAVVVPTVHRLGDAAAVARAAAEYVVDRVEADIARRGRCRLALAGGSTPRPVYRRLTDPEVAARIDWRRVELFWGDERSVAPDHPESNYRMVEESLLRHLPVRPTGVHPIRGDLPAVEAARAYERSLGEEPLDLAILGMGEDGHTASLFPDGPELEETSARVVAVLGPTPPRRRVTLTLRALGDARAVCFVVTGEGKASRVAEVFAEIAAGAPRLPAARVQPTSGELHWFLDEAAARDLGPPATERALP